VPEFVYKYMGGMVSLGGQKAIMDTKNIGELNPDATGKNVEHINLKGYSAALIWHGYYWGSQVSLTNKMLIPMFWFKSWLFGRDISRF
jgi:NADH dehydrogenase FAD-containing subunit